MPAVAVSLSAVIRHANRLLKPDRFRDYEGAVKVLKELRAQEVDARSIRILDDFIQRLTQRAAERLPKDQEGGKQP